jgi:D-beta-D-heptose 7-phosphate kinase/D-beta-D-heptose 1-phosphate adenosyltransferase
MEAETNCVLVIGDLILDKYVYGHADRLSPEAPIPVLSHAREEVFPGGAANVACKIAQLDGGVSLLGVVGDDDEAATLEEELRSTGVEDFMLLDDPSRPTTCKTRYGTQEQQLLRFDVENSELIGSDVEEQVMQAIHHRAPECAAIIIEDYGKGLITERVARTAISYAGSCGSLPVIVDPNGYSWDAYRGATLITPNLHELEMVRGLPLVRDADIEKAARMLRIEHYIGAVAVTLGARGILLVTADRTTLFPTGPTEVFDVTGAGDAVVAAYALALAAGNGLTAATVQANAAGGAIVRQRGVGRISPRMLSSSAASRKVVPPGIANWEVQVVQDRGQKVVFTNGCFDILHTGHTHLLEEARKHGDFLVVGLNSDTSVQTLKGPNRPIMAAPLRAALLAALSAVDLVVIFDEDTPMYLLNLLRPDVLVKGEDYTEEEIVGSEHVRSYGGDVVRIPLIEGSSSNIIKKIRGDHA